MKSVIKLLFSFFIVMLVLTSCSKNNHYKLKKQPVPLRDFLVGEGTYEKLTVQVILTKGQYFDSEHATLGGGIYDENYQGDYVLNLFKESELLSSCNLGEHNFSKIFTIKFDDYNSDHNIDFTIGDSISSNCNEYTIYTIKSDAIQPIGTVLTSEGKKENTCSILLKHDNNKITTSIYDTEKGEMVPVIYTWDLEKNKFILDNEG